MSRLPGVYPVIGNGGLGLTAPSGDGVRVVLGMSSAGDLLTLVSLSDVESCRSLLGYGPLADACADQVALGGGTVYALRVPASVAGGKTAAAGNPAPAITLDGDPNRALDLRVVITTDGPLGTSAFTYSLDGGDTVVGPIATSASYTIPGTPHALKFVAGAYVAGSSYAFTVTAPTASVADIQSGVRVALASPLEFEYIHVAQPTDNSVWAALDSLAVEAENEFRYVFLLADAPGPLAGESVDTWVTRLEAMHSAFASDHVMITAPYAEVVDNLDGTIPTRVLTSRLGARLSSTAVHVDPGWVQLGPVSGLVTAAPFTTGTFGKTPLYNNGHALRLDAAGYASIYTLRGRDGYFWNSGRMASAATSDYSTVTNRRVMNKSVTLVRQVLDFVLQGVDPLELDASLADMVARAKAPLRAMLAAGQITGYNVVIPPGQDILSSRSLIVQVRIVPLGYLREITLDIKLRNPYLTEVAA